MEQYLLPNIYTVDKMMTSEWFDEDDIIKHE